MTFRLPNKHPSETKLLVLPFDEIERGRTIVAYEVLGVTLDAGVDPTPTQIIDGGGAIDQANLQVLQRVTAGLDRCDYFGSVRATDSSGLKHVVQFVLPVRNRIKR